MKWYITSQEEAVESFHDQGEHYTTTAEIFSVLTSPLRLDEPKASLDSVGESTQRRSKLLLCNVRLRSRKIETGFSWFRI